MRLERVLAQKLRWRPKRHRTGPDALGVGQCLKSNLAGNRFGMVSHVAMLVEVPSEVGGPWTAPVVR